LGRNDNLLFPRRRESARVAYRQPPNHRPGLTQGGMNRIEYGNVYVLIKDRAVFAVKGASMSRPGPIDRRFANSRRIVENLAPRAARFTPHE
jgi:hypothetical protein